MNVLLKEKLEMLFINILGQVNFQQWYMDSPPSCSENKYNNIK